MTEQPIPTAQPVSPEAKLLREKYFEQYAGQSELMDKLGGHLITLELAIPGLYAAVLKLVQGEKATLPIDGWTYFTFICWTAALLLTIISLVPRRWKVDPTVIEGDLSSANPVLGVKDFFYKSAHYKRWLLIASITFFWGGIIGAAVTIF
jgi:hypothetical protein